MKKMQSVEMLPVYTLIVGGVALLFMFLLLMSTLDVVSKRTRAQAQRYQPTPQSQQRPNQPNENVQSSVSIIEPADVTQEVLITE